MIEMNMNQESGIPIFIGKNILLIYQFHKNYFYIKLVKCIIRSAFLRIFQVVYVI